MRGSIGDLDLDLSVFWILWALWGGRGVSGAVYEYLYGYGKLFQRLLVVVLYECGIDGSSPPYLHLLAPLARRPNLSRFHALPCQIHDTKHQTQPKRSSSICAARYSSKEP